MSSTKKKTEKVTTVAMVVSVADLVNKSPAELVELCVTNLKVAGAAFVNTAKAIIALDPQLGKGETIYGALTAAGISRSTVSNAMYLVNLYYGLVKTGLVSEVFMAELSYMDAYRLSAIAKKRGGWAGLHAARIHEMSAEDWECLHEHGLTLAQWNQAEETRKQTAKQDEAEKIKAAAAELSAKALAAEKQAKADAPKAQPAQSTPAVAKTQAVAPSTPEPTTQPAAVSPAVSAPPAPAAAPASPVVAKPAAPVAKKSSLAEYRKLLDLARKYFDEMALDESVTPEDVSVGVVATLEFTQAVQAAAQFRGSVETSKPIDTPAPVAIAA